jgi:hypothetical protein
MHVCLCVTQTNAQCKDKGERTRELSGAANAVTWHRLQTRLVAGALCDWLVRTL